MIPERMHKAARCTRCGGDGLDGMRACPLCRGVGSGIVYGPLFLYWGRRVDGFAIAIAKIGRVVDMLIDAALVLLFFGGAYLAYRHAQTGLVSPLTAQFWQTPHPSLFVFWIGVAAFACWYYRQVVAGQRTEPVRPRVYGDDDERLDLPDEPQLWQAVRKLPRARRVDVSKAYSAETLRALDESWKIARKLRCAEVAPSHLFGMLLATRKISVMFARLGLQFEKFRSQYGRLVAALAKDDLGTRLSDATRLALLEAYAEAYEDRRATVEPTDLFLAALRLDPGLQEILLDQGVDLRKADNAAKWIQMQAMLRQRGRSFSSAARLKPRGAMDRAMTAVATPFLDRLGVDLTRRAMNGYIAPVVGREKEFDAVFRAIEGGRRSVVLVGAAGVGKDAIIDGIALKMVEEDVPGPLQDKRLVSLDVSRVVSGATASEAQERLLGLLYEVGRAGNIVLVVRDVGGMRGISEGSEGSIDLSQVFAGELARGYFFCICTARPDDYARSIEGGALGSALTKVEVAEMDEQAAILVLEAKAPGIEGANDVPLSYDAVEASVALSSRYVHEATLPEKAIQIAKEAAAYARKARGKGTMVSKEDVAAVIAEKTKIPLTSLTKEESQKLLTLETRMHERMIGQERAVNAVAAALRRARAELREQGRPIANFLFLGPTGVGKTELAKTLAGEYFGSDTAMIRFDMSEYQDKSAVNKLIGDPSGGAGLLTEAVRRQPFSLLLLDELEKAHPDILTLFLQVMDDGRLTDSTGRTVDFTNVILIATSNAGSQYVQDELRKGSAIEVIKEGLMERELKGVFRPEFLNRFDDIVVFAPLSEDEIARIARLMLGRVASRLAEKGIAFEATDEAVRELAKAGYDPLFGARPLRRVIQDRVDNAVADALLRGEMTRRDKVIFGAGGKLTIEKGKAL